jgi:hypothetical protein
MGNLKCRSLGVGLEVSVRVRLGHALANDSKNLAMTIWIQGFVFVEGGVRRQWLRTKSDVVQSGLRFRCTNVQNELEAVNVPTLLSSVTCRKASISIQTIFSFNQNMHSRTCSLLSKRILSSRNYGLFYGMRYYELTSLISKEEGKR